MTKRNPFAPIKALCLTVLLSACASNAHYEAMQHRNEVQPSRLVETLPLALDGDQLSVESKHAINQFLWASQIQYGDQISMDTGDHENSEKLKIAISNHLNDLGLRPTWETPIVGPLPEPGTGYLIVDRTTLIPVNCHGWQYVNPNVPMHVSTPTFGCTSQANLGQMVANPNDLVAPPSYTGPDAHQASRAVFDHQNGIAPKGVQSASPLSGSSSGRNGGS